MKLTFFLSILSVLNLELHAKQDILLGLGSTTSIKKSNLDSVYVSNGSSLKVRDIEGKLILIGKSIGRSDLLVGDKRYKIEILSKRAYKAYLELKKLTDQSRSLSTKYESPCLVIEGNLLKPIEWERIRTRLRSSKKLNNCEVAYIFRAKIDGLVALKILADLNKEFGNLELDFKLDESSQNLVVRSKVLRLSKGTTRNLEKWGLTADAHGGTYPSFSHKLEVIAVGSDELKQTGIGLPSYYTKSLLDGTSSTSLDLKISDLLSNGKYHSLIRTRIVASRSKASSFHSGGEIAIPLVTETQRSLVWKPYGFIAEFGKMTTSQGRIGHALSVELSSLTGQMSTENIPGIKKNILKTFLNTRNGEKQIALSFQFNDKSKGASGNNSLTNIPLFKSLLKVDNYKKSDFQILIIVSTDQGD